MKPDKQLYCTSPINVAMQEEQLKGLGQYLVSPHKVKMTSKRHKLIEKMRAILKDS